VRPTPFKKPAEPPPPAKKWQEVLDMFTDLARSLETEDRLNGHAQKVEAMKEGLYQIRDVVIERDIAFKEARRQDCLVKRKLSKSLGHSSRCLYALLLFYLYGTVRDMEVHVGKCISGKGGRNVRDFDAANHNGKDVVIKKKNEDAKGVLELHGHLWSLGVEEKTLTYRGDVYRGAARSEK